VPTYITASIYIARHIATMHRVASVDVTCDIATIDVITRINITVNISIDITSCPAINASAHITVNSYRSATLNGFDIAMNFNMNIAAHIALDNFSINNYIAIVDCNIAARTIDGLAIDNNTRKVLFISEHFNFPLYFVLKNQKLPNKKQWGVGVTN
jgi:hypothetical protein